MKAGMLQFGKMPAAGLDAITNVAVVLILPQLIAHHFTQRVVVRFVWIPDVICPSVGHVTEPVFRLVAIENRVSLVRVEEKFATMGTGGGDAMDLDALWRENDQPSSRETTITMASQGLLVKKVRDGGRGGFRERSLR